MLLWENNLWLIDHGAALYFHHNWSGDYLAQSRSPFAYIKQHVLIRLAGAIRQADEQLRPQLTDALLATIVAAIPAVWLGAEEPFATQEEHRTAYLNYLIARRDGAAGFVEEAVNAHTTLL
jgi:hypothetical protein